MIQHQGIFLPAGEAHLTEWMDKSGELVDGKGTYQIKKLREALKWCKQFRVAIDVGAHAGMWSMQLAKRFAHVHAFEPVQEHRECFAMNLDGRDNFTLYHMALGERDDIVAIHTAPTSSGDSWVDSNADEASKSIPLHRLDDVLGPEAIVDFIKLDCEGYELFALRGGEDLVKRNRPCIIVEQKPGRAQKFGLQETEAVDYLRGLGAHLRGVMSGDFILSWD